MAANDPVAGRPKTLGTKKYALKGGYLRLHKFMSKNVERFILFVSGVIISAIVSSLLENTITWSEAILIAMLILLLAAAIYFLGESNNRLQRLADRIEVSVHYVEEPRREQEEIQFRGTVFKALVNLVEEAENEILIIDTTFIAGKASRTAEHSSRAEFLHTIESVIAKRQENGFKYAYINQIPRDAKYPLTYFDSETSNHCRRMLKLKRDSTGPKLNLAVMTVPAQRLTNFMMVDRRHIVFETDGIDSEGDAYAIGMLFLEDRGGKLIEHFLWHFSNLERLAQPIALTDFNK
jgi:hypothetical protein